MSSLQILNKSNYRCKSIIKSEGPNKLVQEQRDLKTEKVVSTITREVNDKDEYVTVSNMSISYIIINNELIFLRF